MSILKSTFVILAAVALAVSAKPSHPFGLHAIPDHFDLTPPVLPATHFHGADQLLPAPEPLFHTPAQFLPGPPAPLVPAPAPYLPAPAPAPWLPAPVPAPWLPAAAPAPLFPAPIPAPLLPAAAPVLSTFAAAPFVHTHALPAALPLAKVLPPVFEAVPFAAPTYRAIPGPKTTTHHVSVGYAFPAPAAVGRFVAAPHAHLHAAPLALPQHHHHLHHHQLKHHSLF